MSYVKHVARADSVRAKEVARSDAPFSIEVRFIGGLSETQQAAFAAAADRWVQVIVGGLPGVELDLSSLRIPGLGVEVIDDVLILAKGDVINGVGHILGQAGPLWWRPDTLLPALGRMTFDTADLERMEADGTLRDVITHEMGHVLGFGKTLWGLKGLLESAGGADPRFVGRAAMVEFAHLTGGEHLVGVPVENLGGAGTRDSHWRESVFGAELMTSRIAAAGNPMSRLTVAALADLGYATDFEAGELYALPQLCIDLPEAPAPEVAALPR
jgi:hypothetical protein